MAALIIIIGIAAFICGSISENNKCCKMTPHQRQQQEKKSCRPLPGCRQEWQKARLYR